jgi:hypothetical protein
MRPELDAVSVVFNNPAGMIFTRGRGTVDRPDDPLADPFTGLH